jgi:hypothetical protein
MGPPTGSDTTPQNGSGYPACSATVTDRCIQLYERGVRSRENMARNDRASGPAVGGPIVSAEVGDYPPCTASRTDRCTQTRSRMARRGHHGTRHHAMRMASRAGERG